MASEVASLWSAVAATFSAVAALTMMFIHRRNMIDAASPEIVIDGWCREIKQVGDTKKDVLTFKKISNVGKGSAFHVSVNATDFESERPLTACSTKSISIIPPGKEVGVNGEILLFWKNCDKSHRMLPIKITINCWSSKNYRYDIVYHLMAMELHQFASVANANEIVPHIWLTTRSSKEYPVWQLKVKEYFSKYRVRLRNKIKTCRSHYNKILASIGLK